MMRSPLPALVLLLAGGAFPATYFASHTQLFNGNADGISPPTSKTIFGPSFSVGDYIVITDNDVCNIDGSPYNIYKTDGTVGFGDGWLRDCKFDAQNALTYEINNCDNKTSPFKVYKWGAQIPSRFQVNWIFDKGNGLLVLQLSPNLGADYTNGNDYASDRFYCKTNQVSSSGGTTLVIFARTGDSTNLCTYTTDAKCEVCAWPYLAVRDTAGCGCIIDRSKYQAPEKLKKQVAVYCNTYSDGTGRQFYLDESRSNFESSKGEIYGACSAPPSTTVYMPVGTCPPGTRPTSDTIPDSTGQPASGTIGKPTSSGGGGTGNGNDTATHNRLDSILGQLSRDSFTDSLLNAAYDSATAGTTGLTATTDSISRTGSRIASNYGDTTGNQLGLTDSAAFDISFRNPWDTTSTIRTSEQTGSFFAWVLTVWKTARSIVLAIWGLVCWWIMLTIAGTI